MTAEPIDSGKGRPGDAYRGVYERLAEAAAAHPEDIAVETHGGRLTYAELDRLSGAIGTHLHNLLGEDRRPIALWLDTGTDLVAALLGALRAGRVYSVVSRRNPPARRRAMVEDLAPAAVVVSDHLMEEARAAGVEAERLISIEALRHGGGAHLRVQSDPHALAGIYYTSGSSGEPKGVMRTRAIIESRGVREQARYGLHPGDRLVTCYSLSAAASLSSMFGTLFGGGTLHIYEAEIAGITPLTELLADPATTVLRIPVELLRSWIDSLPDEAFFPSLRALGSAGDILYRSDLVALGPHVRPDLMIATQYAMSEFGLLASIDFPLSELPPDDVVPVGRPLPGRELVVVGEDGQILASDQVGEICVRADELHPGYWNRPDLNAGLVTPDPTDASRILHRTGDLGKLKPNGQLILSGRKDQRVKIRGFTVDMSAVEAVLMQTEGVRRGVVVARQHPAGERRLVAYIVPSNGETISAHSLRNALAEHLPDYMLPSLFVSLQELPLTRTGKIDRSALPPPRWEQAEKSSPHVEPRDEIERRLAGLWRQHLRAEFVGIDDEFFELGGDSLLAASLMASVEKQFNRPLLVTTMLRAPTIRKQAEILRSAAAQEDDPLLIPVRTAGSREPLFCLAGKGGAPIRFRALLEQVDERHPVYYFRSPGLRQGERTIEIVEEIARKYLTELRRVQPHGPYFLLGESGGGLVAYEMAQQLTGAGEKVGFLGMLDTYIPSYRNRRSSFGTLLRKHTQILTRGGIKGLLDYAVYYSGLLRFKWGRFVDSIRRRWQSIRHAEALERYARVERANVRASRAYILKPFSGTLHLFHAVLQARYEGNVPANGWADIGVKELVVHPLNCYHGNVLFEPFVSEVARILNEHLKHPA